MNDNVKTAEKNHENATNVTTAGHTFPECSTPAVPAHAEQLGDAEESPPVQRIVEIRTPMILKAVRR